MKGFVKFTVSNIKMFMRGREAVFFTFLFPIILMGLLGLAFGKAQDVNFNAVITLPMMFLGDVFIPIKMFPEYIQVISKVMPLTYFSNGLREIMIYNSGIENILFEIFLILVLGVISFAIAIKMFRWE